MWSKTPSPSRSTCSPGLARCSLHTVRPDRNSTASMPSMRWATHTLGSAAFAAASVPAKASDACSRAALLSPSQCAGCAAVLVLVKTKDASCEKVSTACMLSPTWATYTVGYAAFAAASGPANTTAQLQGSEWGCRKQRGECSIYAVPEVSRPHMRLCSACWAPVPANTSDPLQHSFRVQTGLHQEEI